MKLSAVDEAFSIASAALSALPLIPSDHSFYEQPDVDSPQGRQRWLQAADLLLSLANGVPEDKRDYFTRWASDVFIGLGDFERALAERPVPAIGSRSSMQTDAILSLKLALGVHLNGRDVATLFGPKITSFGRKHLPEIMTYLDVQVSQLQAREGRDLLMEWTDDAHRPGSGMSLFSGHASYVQAVRPQGYNFSLSPTAEALCVGLLREAENAYREERDIPLIGEGWIAETALFYSIKEAFPGEEVLHHGQPEWLGRQHLDIYLPARRVAIEYQGEQHDRPIDFFGGEEAFLKNQERDRLKQSKCRSHGVRLLYVRQGYRLADLLLEIAEAR